MKKLKKKSKKNKKKNPNFSTNAFAHNTTWSVSAAAPRFCKTNTMGAAMSVMDETR